MGTKTLHQRTLDLLCKSTLPMRQISAEAHLPYDWLVGIKYRKIHNPSVNRIQRLYEYLSGNRLVV